MICTPENLIRQAKCFRCIPHGMLNAVITQLMCTWAQGGTPTPPAIPIEWLPANQIASWTDNSGAHAGNLATFLATANIPTVTVLNLNATSITSLTHANYLPALNNLNVGYTNLTTLDLTGCSALQTLTMGYCFLLSAVTLTGCTSLKIVSFSYCNNLISLDFSTCHALQNIQGTYSGLETINLTGCAALQVIQLSHTPLTGINVADCTALQQLYLSYTSCVAIDVSGKTNLTTLLAIYIPALVTVNTTGCTALDFINVNFCSDFNNWIGSNDLTAVTVIQVAASGIDNMSFLGSTLLQTLGAQDSPILQTLGLPAANQLVSLNLSNCLSFDPADISFPICAADTGGKLNGVLWYSVVPSAPGGVCLGHLGGKGWSLNFV